MSAATLHTNDATTKQNSDRHPKSSSSSLQSHHSHKFNPAIANTFSKFDYLSAFLQSLISNQNSRDGTNPNQNSREGTNPNRRAASNPIISREGTIRFFKSRLPCSIFQPVNRSALQSRTEVSFFFFVLDFFKSIIPCSVALVIAFAIPANDLLICILFDSKV